MKSNPPSTVRKKRRRAANSPTRPSSGPLFEVRGLTVRRDGVTILRAIDWAVGRGEHWVLVGPNGSGKTSLLKALTGYMAPTDGTVSVFGKTYGAGDWRKLRERIGIVSASVAHLVHDEDIAEEIVGGGRRAMIGVWGRFSASDRARARRLLRFLRIGHTVHRAWEVLSQGERQRVLIARALMPDPALLILDEPCAGLDPVARERFLTDVARLARRPAGPSLVFVTHHIEEILPEFSHLLALRKGRIASAGPLAQTLTASNLSHVFDTSVRLRRKNQRFAADTGISPAKRR